MLALLFLLVTSLAGFAVATRAIPSAPTIVRAPAGFLLGIVFTSWTTYLVAAGLAGATDDSLTIGLIVSTVLGMAVLAIFGRSLRLSDLRLPWVDVGVAVFALVLASWLIHAHLRSDDGQLMVSSNTWGDMGLHIALSRSFSVAANYPTEYPFFAGEPIRYHFGFDFFAGMLQTGGFSVQRSFNLPGILGFTSMMLLTLATARMLFSPDEQPRWWRDRGIWAGFVAVALLMTNQSLGWWRFIEKDGQGSLGTALRPSVWWNHKDYLTGGPYTNDRIAQFNTPNVYLTQMHLIVAMALVMLLAYVVLWQLRAGDKLSKRLLYGVGVTFGAAFWLNGVVWIAAAIFLGMLLVLWGVGACWTAYRAAAPDARREAVRAPAIAWLRVSACFAVPALLLGVPQALWLNGGGTGGGLGIHLGYLVCASTTSSCAGGQMNPFSLADWWSFVVYWWLNEGVFIPLLIAAFFLGTHRDKKIIGAITCIFIWGSVFHVGQDVGGQNHKVFNLWENLSGLFVAFALVSIWIIGGGLLRRGVAGFRVAGVLTRAATVGLGVLLTISGFIDFMTVKNDFRVPVFGDAAQRQATAWIVDNTPPRATFLTDYDQLYTAPTMAGRGIALGYSSWASAAGYDIAQRTKLITGIYAAPDKATACSRLKASKLDYVLVGPQELSSPRFKINPSIFAQMTSAATIGTAPAAFNIYRVADNC